MNIFYLDHDVVKCAQYHCNKHMKMIVEYAQLLSTAHRILDGYRADVLSTSPKTGKQRRKTVYIHANDLLYKASHINHPCAIWCRSSSENYNWLYSLFIKLCDEYTVRYDKVHACDNRFRNLLYAHPEKIKRGAFTQPALCMKSEPQCIDVSDPIGSYRAFYRTKLKRMKMIWTKREVPVWFTQ